MKTTLRLLPLIALAILVASCGKTPDHAGYIPKDAQFVLGVNTGAMQKKLTWSFLTGSDMLKELREAGAGNEAPAALSELQNSGLDFSSTLYLYTKSDTRYQNNTRVNAVLPVSNASQVEAYIRKHVPGVTFSDRNGRKVASTEQGSLSWNDKVLIVTSSAVRKETVEEQAAVDTLGGMPVPVDAYTYTRESPDPQTTLAELDSAFVKSSESLLSDKRFKQLEGEGHDVSMWISYDQLMNGMRGQQGMAMLGVMGGTFWQNSAVAAGMDFKDGEILASGKYYGSDSMQTIMKEFAKNNIDESMLQRLPAQGLNFALGYHLNTAALKMMLDKMGMTMLANMALAEQGLNIDDILGAFSGDLVMAVNNFRVETRMQEVDSVMREQYGITPQEIKRPDADIVFAMKVKDEAKMQKLMGFVSKTGSLKAIGPNAWMLENTDDGGVLMQQNCLLVAGNKQPIAATFISGGGSMAPAIKQEIAGHPYGMWADVNSFINGAASAVGSDPADAATFEAVRGVFSSVTANGGEFKGDASIFNLKVELTNKKENSLLQLAQLAKRVAAARKARPVAVR